MWCYSFINHDTQILDAEVMEEEMKHACHEFAITPSYLAIVQFFFKC